ncbi:small ribosomal subunit protein mS29 isoform X1 [Bos javanicus]|uniref:small ribosomal subunit protein mS29 isoform X1 n=1 Tax=Bos javanicus TaxID=9906 RepID=UPI002AA95C2C|nr:small ribosomal subunit protein mS29 isoform X1 [Bos javanicus]
MAAGAAAAERRRRQLLGREGAKGASCPPTSHSSLLAFSPFVLPPHPTRAAERARPPARARVYLGLSLAAPTNHRLRPPCAPASQYALPLGRLVAQSSPSPRPLSSQLWRGPSRVPSAARAQASSSTSSPLLPPFPAPTATNRRHGRRGLLLLRPPRHTLHPSRVRLPQSPPLDCSIPVGCRSGGEDDRRSGQSLPLGHELPRATERNLWLFTSLAAAPWRRSFLFWPRPGRGERVGGGLAPLRWRVVGGCGGCALSSFLPYDPSLFLRCGTRGVETALDSVCRLPGRGSWFVTRTGIMLKGMTRLVSRVHKLDPGRFLHLGTQAPQCPVAHLDNQVPTESPRAISRTLENDPAKHGEQHVGQHYNISIQELKTVFPHGLPPRFVMQVKTFNEACLMVRKPALELLHYLKNTNFAHPAVRYVLYGEKGTGKTLSLCHIIHFCAKQDWLILHIPDAHLWVKNCRDLLQSTYNKQRFDQPLEASIWLKNFKTANERFLSQIKVQDKYVWNKRESTEKGSPLAEVVEQGIMRVRNATDAVGIVLKELKRQSSLGVFRLLVAVDGVNALWGRTTLKREDKSPITPEELALIYNLRKMVKNDWQGGAIVLTVSQTGSLFKPRKAYLPQELLGKEGFDTLDPFIPILVSNYNPKEFEGCIQYYLENNWLQHEKAHTEEGKKELLFLSNRNPGLLERLCAYL